MYNVHCTCAAQCTLSFCPGIYGLQQFLMGNQFSTDYSRMVGPTLMILSADPMKIRLRSNAEKISPPSTSVHMSGPFSITCIAILAQMCFSSLWGKLFPCATTFPYSLKIFAKMPKGKGKKSEFFGQFFSTILHNIDDRYLYIWQT